MAGGPLGPELGGLAFDGTRALAMVGQTDREESGDYGRLRLCLSRSPIHVSGYGEELLLQPGFPGTTDEGRLSLLLI